MGAHYIEQNIVMIKDEILIVLHDVTSDRTTVVSEKFPDWARDNGKYYVVDFSIAEIRTLVATEVFLLQGDQKLQEYSNRFPMNLSSFSIPTFEEELQLIKGLNKSTGKDVGVYPEIRQPEFHRSQGKDISTAVVKLLKQCGYPSRGDKVFLQTFSFEELKIIKNEILPKAKIDLNLIQLIGNQSRYPWMFDEVEIQILASFADGVGPEKGIIISNASTVSNLGIAPLVSHAHAAG